MPTRFRGAAHPLTENFSVFGFHLTGSTGTLFLFGIVVGGAVALLALSVLWAGARRTLDDRRARRRAAAREMAFTNRDTFLEHQQRVDTPTRN